LAGLFEQSAATVNLSRREQQQLDQCRVQIIADHQGSGRRDQSNVGARYVPGQVDDALRQRDLREETMAPGIGVGAPEIHRLNIVVGQQ
jgi:hypothetical protein